MALHERVRELMRVHALRQVDLAPLLGISQGQLSKKLNGHVPFSVREVAELRDLFGAALRREVA